MSLKISLTQLSIPADYETSSSTIAAALSEIAKNKDVQKKDEITIKRPTEEDFTYDNMMSLDYLDQVWYGEFISSKMFLEHVLCPAIFFLCSVSHEQKP